MNNIVGIVPAAGEGSRWGGYFKELLPTKKGEWLLDRTIKSMVYANQVYVITRNWKAQIHQKHLENKFDHVALVPQQNQNDIMGAIMSAYPFKGTLNYFAMPDTYIPEDVFTKTKFDGSHFWLGLHRTKTPERFGVFKDGRVYNKKTYEELGVPVGTPVAAWGTLVWTEDVFLYWKKAGITDYTFAINSALRRFPFSVFYMDYYYDMATFDDYRVLLHRIAYGDI